METLRDLGLFGMFLALTFTWGWLVYSFGMVGNYFSIFLFPIVMLFLSFRRAVVFVLVNEAVDLLLVAVRIHFMSFIIGICSTLYFLPFLMLGVFVFKKLQRHIPMAVLGYYFCSAVAPLIGIALFMTYILFFNDGLLFWLADVSGVKASILELANSKITPQLMSNLPVVSASPWLSPSAMEVPLRLLSIAIFFGAPAITIILFLAECWVLKTLRKRTACLPLNFPT